MGPDACRTSTGRSPLPGWQLHQKPHVTDSRGVHLRAVCRWHSSAPLCPQSHRGAAASGPVHPCEHMGDPNPAACGTLETTPICIANAAHWSNGAGQDCPARGLTRRALWRGCQVTPGLAPRGLGRGPRLLPSTQAGRALVVPAICPFLHAQRAVCRAIVLRGWLLSRSSVTISQVPAAS